MSSLPEPLFFATAGRLRTGIDTVQVARIADSWATYGERFLKRLYTPDEIAYALAASAHTVERLAVRFAAKEAVIKALGLSEAGVRWTDIEVRRNPDGACWLALHGRAAEVARKLHIADLSLSLSHEADHAVALVVAFSDLVQGHHPSP